MKFKINSKFNPAGDQPQAIEKLVQGIKSGQKYQTLLGVTGSGKTFTIANVIEKVQKPTLVIAHNKTLAAQLCSEFRAFFPDNAVEYFVSYYDYYQPEAYMAGSDVYIEKEAEINKEIERLRHAATQALLNRKDVIIISSVSCIYGLGDPKTYSQNFIYLKRGGKIDRNELIKQLVGLYFSRSEILERGKFRIHGNTIEIMPVNQDIIYRIELVLDVVESVTVFEALTMKKIGTLEELMINSAKHFVVEDVQMQEALKNIEKELDERLAYFEKHGKLVEADRLRRRTRFDLEMMREIGYCSGIENYSRHLTARAENDSPYTLMDYFPNTKKQGSFEQSEKGSYFPKDYFPNTRKQGSSEQSEEGSYLVVIDESHVTVPQIGGMYAGDRSRKESLVEYGFRLPSAYDNRPLKFNEFIDRIPQVIFTSATPGKFEQANSTQVVEQVIRPTGLVDPELEIRPLENQIADLIKEIKIRAQKHERTLVTTITKKMAEQLSEFLKNEKIKSAYIHSDVQTLDRVKILEDLRRGKYDCLVGVNLLREGLDLPEVTLVAILDADKEGFLRSDVSLIQTIGRAARNVDGKVIMYADNITGSMRRAIDETERRRAKQIAYNKKHNITPQTIKKNIESIIDHELKPEVTPEFLLIENLEDLPKIIRAKEKAMKQASADLKFEAAAILRDEIIQLKKIKTD